MGSAGQGKLLLFTVGVSSAYIVPFVVRACGEEPCSPSSLEDETSLLLSLAAGAAVFLLDLDDGGCRAAGSSELIRTRFVELFVVAGDLRFKLDVFACCGDGLL